MRYLVQRPLENELLVSCLIRTCRRIDVPVSELTNFLASGIWAPSFFHLSHLPELADALLIPASTLLWKHTHFPYASAFLHTSIFTRYLAEAVSGSKSRGGLSSINRSVSLYVRYRRFCWRCAAEDRANWGTSYWHREHNLPGVAICLKHNIVLRETGVSTRSVATLDKCMPHEVPGTRLVERQPNQFQVELARQSVALLNRPLTPCTSVPRDHYRNEFVKRGFSSQGRRISQQLFSEYLKSIAGRELSYLGFQAQEASLNWAALMTRTSVDIPFSPLKHLMLRAALALPEGLANSTLDYIPIGGPKKMTWARDQQFAAQLRNHTQKLISTNQKSSVIEALVAIGAYGPYRHSSERYPELKKAVLQHRRSAASLRLMPKK